MSEVKHWGVDLIEECVIRVRDSASLDEKDRERVDRYLPLLKSSHKTLIELLSKNAPPGSLQKARLIEIKRFLDLYATCCWFLGIATHISNSGETFTKKKTAKNARIGKKARYELRVEDCWLPAVEEALGGRPLKTSEQMAKLLEQKVHQILKSGKKGSDLRESELPTISAIRGCLRRIKVRRNNAGL